VPIFLVTIYGNMVAENIMHQQLQKICRENVCRIKGFLANLGKFGQNILLPAPTPMDTATFAIAYLFICVRRT